MGYFDDDDDDSYWYDYYRGRYYDDCTEVNGCENRLSVLKEERKKIVERIVKLKKDIKDTEDAIDGVTKAKNCEEDLNSSLTIVANKTEPASKNYCDMVEASDITSKKLTEVYSDETKKTTGNIQSALSILSTKLTELNNRLADLKTQLRQAETELQNKDNEISNENSNLSYWNNQKRSDYYNMSYYS